MPKDQTKKVPDEVRQAVKEKVMKDLEAYFEQAEEMEDDTMPQADVEARTKDFYLYQHEVVKGEA